MTSRARSAPLLRGLRKANPPKEKPRVLGSTLDKIVRLAITDGDILEARLYVVAFTFLTRVQSELWPLQLNGEGSPRWHSRVEFASRRVTIHWRKRKNSDKPTRMTRPCICDPARKPRSSRCGVCALRALARSHVEAGRSLDTPLFRNLHKTKASLRLRARCLIAGVAGVSWHAFRRGAASDILRKGGTVAYLMHSGGWKTAAFMTYLQRGDLEDRRTLELARDSDSDSDHPMPWKTSTDSPPSPSLLHSLLSHKSHSSHTSHSAYLAAHSWLDRFQDTYLRPQSSFTSLSVMPGPTHQVGQSLGLAVF